MTELSDLSKFFGSLKVCFCDQVDHFVPKGNDPKRSSIQKFVNLLIWIEKKNNICFKIFHNKQKSCSGNESGNSFQGEEIKQIV